ncbi:MAG: helix-turn-helix domain-containing protein [Nanoarchaeota archaeon]
MGCDLCGYSGELFNAQIEGSMMSVCRNCLKFGVLIEKKRDFNVEKAAKIKFIKEEPVVLLKEDYNLIVKELREKQNFTQEDLAKKLNEKLSLIHKIENKDIRPNDEVVKKFENFFKVKLTQEYMEEKMKLDFKNNALTIGDLLKLKKK